jgi:hypothetical protein
MFTLQTSFKPLLLIEGGVKSVIRDDCDCEWQGGKLLRLSSRLRSRIRPLDSKLVNMYVKSKKVVQLSRNEVRSGRNEEIN